MLEIITPPTSYPVSLDAAKEHLRVDGTADDSYISGLIAAACQTVGNDLGMTLAPTGYRQYCPGGFFVPVLMETYPVSGAGLKLIYFDAAGSQQIVDPNDYDLVTWTDPQRIHFHSTPPAVISGPSTVPYVEFTAGFEPDTIPPQIRQAVLFLIAHWYDRREPVSDKISRSVPLAYEYLVWKYRRKHAW